MTPNQFMTSNSHPAGNMRLAASIVLLLIGGFHSVQARAEAQTPAKRDGHVLVQAFADRQAISPGQTVMLAIRLKMDKDWHVYWRNPGGTGLPTRIDWSAPAGFVVSRTLFPYPTVKYDKVLRETSFIHEETAVFLTKIQVPAEVRVGSQVDFQAHVRWLACKQNCIPGRAELKLSLPVVSKQSPLKLAHKEAIESAEQALPTPGKKAEHLTLTGAIDAQDVKPGNTFTATLTAQIASKHHMQSHKPLQDYLIPAFVFVESAEGLDIGAVRYPKSHIRTDKILGKLSEYQGKVAFEIPIEVDKDAEKIPRTIRGVFQYQICTDSGSCYRPEHVTFEIPISESNAKSASVIDHSTAHLAEAVSASPEQDSPSQTAENVTGIAQTHKVATTGPTMVAPVTQSNAHGGRSFLIRAQNWLIGSGLFGVILAGLLGGLIMNVMPCVLPVLSLKVLSFVRQAHEDRWRVFRLGLVYSAGIMVFYGVLALLFYWKGTGWGELFQSPRFVIAIGAIVTAFALSLFGVFALFTPKIVFEMDQKMQGEGYLSAFGTGLLATILGTACTAPFLSAAIAYATKLPVIQGTAMFLTVGFGMASPILLLTYKPDWLRWVPKPGPWMGVFENVIGFILLGTVIWILWPLPNQIGGLGLLLSLIFILSVSIAVWVKGKIEFGAPVSRKIKLYALATATLVVGWVLPFRILATIPELRREYNEHEELYARGFIAKYGKNLDWSNGIPWQPYIRDVAMEDIRNGFTVFVDYTASWCASCKANKAAFINRADVIQVMRELNVIPYEADYTNYNQVIKADLERFGRAGVPMYLVYKPRSPDHPEVLPELLTQQTIIDALRRAGPSQIKLVKSK